MPVLKAGWSPSYPVRDHDGAGWAVLGLGILIVSLESRFRAKEEVLITLTHYFTFLMYPA